MSANNTIRDRLWIWAHEAGSHNDWKLPNIYLLHGSLSSEEMNKLYNHPKVKEAERYTIETAIKMGVRPRIELTRWEDGQPYIDMGVKDFCIGSDVGSFFEFCKDQGEGMAKALGK